MGGLSIFFWMDAKAAPGSCVCRDLLVWVVILVIYIHFFPLSSILLDVISFFGEKPFEIFEAYDGAVPA